MSRMSSHPDGDDVPGSENQAPTNGVSGPSLQLLHGDPEAQLRELLSQPLGRRMEPLISFAEAVAAAGLDGGLRGRVAQALLELIEGFAGNARQRMAMGRALSHVGDPRLRRPQQAEYWAEAPCEDGSLLSVGRFLVTNAEFRAWVEEGGYDDPAAWSEDGLAWKASGAPPWAKLAADPGAKHLIEENQPVAGPTWYEAEAYARAHGARLMTVDERRAVVRGPEKRPYPWGAPFGDGNANTREEALGQPCAVGLYPADRTPEGVYDLAGNMGEWLGDSAGDKKMLHPGSWARPSMASWAKALELAPPEARSADMSFRLVRG